jgi:ribosomal protein S1
LVDATCPFVRKVQEKVREYYDKGYQIIIVGDAAHPEVKGVNGWCNYSAIIVNSASEAGMIGYYDRLCVVAQTTITSQTWEEVKEILKDKGSEVKFFNTICNATFLRQQAAAAVAEQADVMIVIGGFHSSNTQKLYCICKQKCENTFHIEEAGQLPADKILKANIVGVTAGASTPDWIIKEVIDKMEQMENERIEVELKNDKEEGIESEQVKGQQVEDPAVQDSDHADDKAVTDARPNKTQAEPQPTMENMESMMVQVKPGKIVTGRVIKVGLEDVIVNIGYKSDGIITKDELTADPSLTPSEVVSEGDEIDVFVKKIDEKEGHVILSKKKVDIERAWKTLKEKFEDRQPIDVKVVEEVKGGLIAIAHGIRGFMPASHVDLGYVEKLQEFIGRVLSVKIIEFNRSKGKVIMSRKVLLEEEREAKKKEILESLKEGDRITGEVKRLTDFGAFVDIGGIDGLVHISEISWNRIGHPSEMLKVGDTIEVVVLGVEPENERISLGYKQTRPHPWDNIQDRYKAGQVITGKVVRLVDFGAFVELEPGVEGLVHISQISFEHVDKPGDVLREGQQVQVKILDVKPEDRRISLSIKEAIDRPKREEKKEKPQAQAQAAHTDNEPPITIGDIVGDIFKDDQM